MNAQQLMILGMISQMPEEDQTQINNYADKLRELMKEGGENALIAYGLVGTELQDE